MRIGIVTHWMAEDNYGGMLQSFALQRYLRELGHDAFLIRFFIKNTSQKSLSVRGKTFLKELLINLNLYPKAKEIKKEKRNNKEWINKRNFDEFRTKNIALSPHVYYSLDDIQNNPPEADMYITGSDQVWAGDLNNPNIWIFYLAFGSQKIKRISYAASFGFSYFPGKNVEKFKELLSQLDMISVREKSGVDICRENGFDAVRCIDSTLLLDKDVYKSLMTPQKYKGHYAYFYTVNVSSPEEIYWPAFQKKLSEKGTTSVVTTGKGYTQAKEIFEGACYDYATVEEWLSDIYYSDVVITASFHGIVFSIILQKDFIYMPLQGRAGGGNNRVIDLLESAKLSNRIAQSAEGALQLLEQTIDYTNLDDSALSKLIVESKEFLGRALRNRK